MNRLVRLSRVANFIGALAGGATQKAVAAQFGVSVGTVRAELRWAQREGLFDKAENAIAERLIPLAIDVYEVALKRHLHTGDYEAAEKLLKGVRLFKSGPELPSRGGFATQSEDDDSWEQFTAARTSRLRGVIREITLAV